MDDCVINLCKTGVPKSGITVYMFDRHTLGDSGTESEASGRLPHNQQKQLPMVNNTVHSHVSPALSGSFTKTATSAFFLHLHHSIQ